MRMALDKALGQLAEVPGIEQHGAISSLFTNLRDEADKLKEAVKAERRPGEAAKILENKIKRKEVALKKATDAVDTAEAAQNKALEYYESAKA